jgi:hypothetical protein
MDLLEQGGLMAEGYREICFRLEPEAYEKLKHIADEDETSIEALVKNISNAYIERRTQQKAGAEKREFIRNQTNLPVVIQLMFEPGEAHYRTGTIKDISMGGVRISLPKQEQPNMEVFDRCNRLEILFRLPGEEYTVTFTCRPSRMNMLEDTVQFGASFTEADLRSQQMLHKYVM